MSEKFIPDLADVGLFLDFKGYFTDSIDKENNTICFIMNNMPPTATFTSGIKKIDKNTIKIKNKTYRKIYDWVDSLPLSIELDKWRTYYNTYHIGDALLCFDAHIADVCIELNRKGYPTYCSCGGHYTYNDYTPIYIGFEYDIPSLPNIDNCKIKVSKEDNIMEIYLNTVTIEERDRVLKELLQWVKDLPICEAHLNFWKSLWECYDWDNVILVKSCPLSDIDRGCERWQV